MTSYSTQVRRVLIVTLALNSCVALAKVLYGYMTNSIAMTSDGFHSFFDGVSNVIGLIGVWIASHPPDRDHPYGHRKFETLFTIVIGVMILLTCLQILKEIYGSVFKDHKPVVTGTSFAIMIATMAVNVGVMTYESRKGKQLGSDFLAADSLHTKSDIYVSGSVIAGLLFTRMGYYYADVAVGIIIVFLIARIGYRILKDASNILVDSVCMDSSPIRDLVNGVAGVRGCHEIRTRGSANAVYLDLHVLVDRNMSTEHAHSIADIIEEKIKTEFPAIVDIMVHIEPEEPDDSTSRKSSMPD